jgi:hypothetical protein
MDFSNTWKLRGLISRLSRAVHAAEPIMPTDLAEILSRVLTPEPWCVDDISYDGEVLEISGWALPPEGRPDLATFMVNDREFEVREFPLLRPDVGKIFWFKEGSDQSGFRCRSSITREELFKDGYSTLKCIDRRTGLPVREDFNIYYSDDAGPELPDTARRRRVWEDNNPVSFQVEGFSTFKKLDFVLARRPVGRSAIFPAFSIGAADAAGSHGTSIPCRRAPWLGPTSIETTSIGAAST